MSSKVSWTPQQQKAIGDRGLGMIVSAAAGSGKTAVLIERMIQLLSDEQNKIPADRLLAVTFTTDAAAQMKEKLSKAFAERLRKDPDNKWLLSQQNLLQLARISTINSFCLDLVRSNLNMFDFSGGLGVLEENVQTLIYERSRDAALEKLCESDPESYELLISSFTRKTLEEVIEAFYSFLRSLPFREQWLEKAEKNFTDPEVFEGLIEKRFKGCESQMTAAWAALERFEKDCAYECAAFKLSDYAKICDNAADDRDRLTELDALIRARDIEAVGAFNTRLSSIKTPRWTSKALRDTDPMIMAAVNERCEIAKSHRAVYSEAIKSISAEFELSREIMLENMETSRKLMLILARVCEMIDEISMKEKIDRNGITFSDAELMAKELLVTYENGELRRTELAEEIRKNRLYELIFIDEFQDVNNLQELVFRVLSDTDDLSIMGRNVFVVGDVKQAIYKFRLSNPDLFIKTQKDAEDPENSDQLESVVLNCNFRSRQEVIDLVNFCFSGLMSGKCGGVTYDESQSLVRGANYDERESPAEILFIDNDPAFKRQHGFSRENYETALIIKKMIEDKYPVYEDGKSRECRAGDFCILAQTNAEIRAAAAAIEAVGLRVSSKDTDGYLKAREVSLALDMLRVIDDPMNDLALAALMLSPILGFTPEEAAKLSAVTTRARPSKHYWQVIVASDKQRQTSHEKEAEYIDLGDDTLQKKCVSALKLIDKLRFMSMNMSLEKLIRSVYDMTDLMGITSLYLDADKKRANLRLLLQYADSYEKNSLEGVTGFLRYIDSVSSNNSAFSKAVTAVQGGDSVNIKTYHASKGLEYPFVFLTQLDKQFDPISDAVIKHNDLGCAFRFTSDSRRISKKSIYYDYLKQNGSFEDKSERMRLLYVGCTRAKEKLFVCCAPSYKKNEIFEKAITDKQKIIASLRNRDDITPVVADANSMLDWFIISLFRLSDSSAPELWFGADSLGIKKSDLPDPEIVFTDLSGSTSEPQITISAGQNSGAVDNRLLSELKKRADSDADRERQGGGAASKMTVTEVVAHEHEKKLGDKSPEFFPNLPRLDDELDKLSNAERGTFTHKFMEVADYGSAEKNVGAELQRLVDKGFFTKKEASGVYTDALESFFASDLYSRIKRSDEVMRERAFLVSYSELGLSDRFSDVLADGSILQGIADCIFKEDGGYVIVDYKTDRFTSEEDAKKYAVQLELYKAAFGLILDAPVKECCIYSFMLKKEVRL